MEQHRLPHEIQDALADRTPDDQAAMARIWEALGALPDTPLDVPADDAAWADVRQRMAAQASPHTHDRRASSRGRARSGREPLRLLRWSAAGLAASLVLFALWWQRPITVTVPVGSQQIVTLPDGSVVELNSASQLRYARGFTGLPLVSAAERSVRLDGEAFFRVVSSDRPFVVETFNSRIDVLGTQFNVRARPARTGAPATTAITLAEGRVQVTDAARTRTPVVLAQPGEHVVFGSADTLIQEPVVIAEPDRFWAWRTAGFAFVDEPLAAIVAELERRFALRVTLDAGLDGTETLSLFKQPGTTVEQVLHDLCLAQQCRYRTTSQGYALAPAAASEAIGDQ